MTPLRAVLLALGLQSVQALDLRPKADGAGLAASSAPPKAASTPQKVRLARAKAGLVNATKHLPTSLHELTLADRAIADASLAASEAANGSKSAPKPKNRWIDLGRKVRVYVYDLKALRSNKDFTVDSAAVPNYGFETVFRKLLQGSKLHRTYNPEKADFYYVPVDMCSIRAFWWQKPNKMEHMRALDESVVAAMRKVGPFWDKKNDRHIVSSCRCPKVGAAADVLNPELWGRNTTLRLCLQTRVTSQRSKEAIDTRRSLHVGYHVPVLESRMAHGRRSTLAVYMGYAMNSYREKVAAWMKETCKDCASFELERRASLPADLQEKYHKTLRHARFSIEPPGETLERMSRDASVLAGAVPVIFEFPEDMPRQSLPWYPVLNWSRFSVNFTLTPEEAQGTSTFVPRLEEKLRGMVESGEADKLQKGVMEARERAVWTETGALDTVMGMLAWRMAGMPEPAGPHHAG